MSAAACLLTRRRTGFTLIEVVGALLIFSVGVLMVIQVSGALGTQMRYAGLRSEIAVRVDERVDSLASTPFDSIAAGTIRDTVSVQGEAYERLVAVTSITPLLARIEVALTPVGGSGPSHAVTSYASSVW